MNREAIKKLLKNNQLLMAYDYCKSVLYEDIIAYYLADIVVEELALSTSSIETIGSTFCYSYSFGEFTVTCLSGGLEWLETKRVRKPLWIIAVSYGETWHTQTLIVPDNVDNLILKEILKQVIENEITRQENS